LSPETPEGFPQPVRVSHAQVFPPSREQPSIAHFIEASVNEQHNAVIGFRADDSANGLEHAVHARKSVGVFKSTRVLLLKIIPDQIAFDTKLWQADPDNHRADESFTNQINAISKNSAQSGEADEGFTMLHAECREEVN